MPARIAFAGDAKPSREQAEHDGILGPVGAGHGLGHVPDRHGQCDGRPDPGKRQAIRRNAGLAFVDHDGVTAHRQLGPELEEVLPVERHRDVQRAARAVDRLRRNAQPAGRLAAPDLRAEALGHDRVVAFQRRCGYQRLPCGHDAVAAGACHSYDEVIGHTSLSRIRIPGTESGIEYSDLRRIVFVPDGQLTARWNLPAVTRRLQLRRPTSIYYQNRDLGIRAMIPELSQR